MLDFIDIVEVNPIMFVKKISEAVSHGFYVQNTMAGFPVMGMPMVIRLFETEAPAIVKPIAAEEQRVLIEGYSIMEFLLEVQDAALQGYAMAISGATVDNYKGVWMEKAIPVTFEGIDVPAAVVEPAKPKAKRTTTPKTKSE